MAGGFACTRGVCFLVGFITFLQGLIPRLDSSKRNVLVMGNASIHKVNEVKKLILENKLECLHTAPWSSMLDPIEECFSKVKVL